MKNLAMLMATMVLSIGVYGMTPPSAVKVATLEQLTRGAASLQQYMRGKNPIYIERIVEAMARVAGDEGEGAKEFFQSFVATNLSKYEERTAALEQIRSDDVDKQYSLEYFNEKLPEITSALKAEVEAEVEAGKAAEAEFDDTLDKIKQLPNSAQLQGVLISLSAALFAFDEHGKAYLDELEKMLVSKDIPIEQEQFKVLTQFLEAPIQQNKLFASHVKREISAQELVAELSQLTEKHAEMGIFPAEEMEEIRQALQLGEYAGIVDGL